MTTNTDTRPPACQLPEDVADYLHDLAVAAQQATVARDRARLEDEAADWPAWDVRYRPTGTDHACNNPLDSYRSRLTQGLQHAAAKARETHQLMAGWYARAATLSLRAVLAGEPLTPRQLELATIDRLDHAGRLRDPNDEPWFDTHVPPLLDVNDLLTGHDVLDRPLHDRYGPMEAAYRALGTATTLGEQTSLADHEATMLSDASTAARPLPDLLISWAEAAHQAALYGRSPAYGHRPA